MAVTIIIIGVMLSLFELGSEHYGIIKSLLGTTPFKMVYHCHLKVN